MFLILMTYEAMLHAFLSLCLGQNSTNNLVVLSFKQKITNYKWLSILKRGPFIDIASFETVFNSFQVIATLFGFRLYMVKLNGNNFEVHMIYKHLLIQ